MFLSKHFLCNGIIWRFLLYLVSILVEKRWVCIKFMTRNGIACSEWICSKCMSDATTDKSIKNRWCVDKKDNVHVLLLFKERRKRKKERKEDEDWKEIQKGNQPLESLHVIWSLARSPGLVHLNVPVDWRQNVDSPYVSAHAASLPSLCNNLISCCRSELVFISNCHRHIAYLLPASRSSRTKGIQLKREQKHLMEHDFNSSRMFLLLSPTAKLTSTRTQKAYYRWTHCLRVYVYAPS